MEIVMTKRNSAGKVGSTGLRLVYQTQPKKPKTTFSRVPLPQRERILQQFVSGKSIRAISREEGRARETVTAIVRSKRMGEIVSEMQIAHLGLLDKAVESLRRALERDDEGWLSFRMLEEAGFIKPWTEEDNGIVSTKIET
jgi:hypothetical protein